MKEKVIRKTVTIKDEKVIKYLDELYENNGESYTDLINQALKEKYYRDNVNGDSNDELKVNISSHRLNYFHKNSFKNNIFSFIHKWSESKESYYSLNISLDDFFSGFLHLPSKLHEALLYLKSNDKVKKFISSKLRSEIKDNNINYDNADFLIALISSVNIEFIGLIKDVTNHQENINISLRLVVNWNLKLINFSNVDTRCFDFFNIKYYRYKQYFEKFKIDDAHIYACLCPSTYGGYFIRVFNNPVSESFIRNNMKFKNKISVSLNPDSITVDSKKSRSNYFDLNDPEKIMESSHYDILENYFDKAKLEINLYKK